MLYKVRVSHINSDFTFEPACDESWTDEIADDDGLIFLMNRVAVATSQEKCSEFPEIEITKGSKRAVIMTVGGQLYYNEAKSGTRLNLKVVPDEVIALLADKPLDQVFTERPEDANDSFELDYEDTSRPSRGVKISAYMVLIAILCFSGFSIYKELTYQPSLVEAPQFIHQLEGQGAALRQYSGVYLNNYRERCASF